MSLSLMAVRISLSPLFPLRPGDAGRVRLCGGRVGGTVSSGLSGVLQPPHQLLAVHRVCQDGRHKSCCGGPGRTALCYWYSMQVTHTQAIVDVLLFIFNFIYFFFPSRVHMSLCNLVGGAVLEDGDGTDLAQVYNPKTSVWTEVAPMQIARSGSAVCTLKGKIYVIGMTLSSARPSAFPRFTLPTVQQMQPFLSC